MSSIGKRLLASTADLAAAVAAKTAATSELPKPAGPRTAPGQMLAARSEMLTLQGELAELRDKLQQFDGSLPTVKLDPALVQATAWANRHEQSFATPAFARLKASIELAGGNAQPILVRRAAEAGRYEVVFGHRRHRACLELGLAVLAVLWDGPMPDLDLFLSMDRENREREDPSAYEQGQTYVRALEAGLFVSQRRLAEAIGVSHTWVRKAIQVAQLPEAIVEAFASPLEVQPKHAEEIHAALEADRKTVLRRAERLRQSVKRLPAGQVVAHLLGRAEERLPPQRIQARDRVVGNWRRDPKGRALIVLDAPPADDAMMQRICEAIAQVLDERVAT
ncbi:ParB/RepB/Spo0J family partition protein [Aquincola sp. S2]|uniref:ParB/RepB/Spo0J family partition protein n=1 Tax=Pseudaquabacterium terrae TaxID=2732868 RepID=A0ABX2EAZ9_9BURK|nr:ParB/RepB/Spo0J family partition protein [Aquabacterium terrae]NRF65579.1 ParB/RepB/Spo0J family partition protein [Aquabacterium terrae]